MYRRDKTLYHVYKYEVVIFTETPSYWSYKLETTYSWKTIMIDIYDLGLTNKGAFQKTWQGNLH